MTHLPSAISILQQQQIRSGLVFDKSLLNTQRVEVVWLSPNDWSGTSGFRYGNVRFQFDWASLVSGKKYYWVESIAYGVAACRILVTSKTHPKLTAYDPAVGDGPWWYDGASGTHYYNGKFCLEFMLEDDLPTSAIVRADFVNHHAENCAVTPKSPQTCQQLGHQKDEGGGRFLAAAAAIELPLQHLDLATNGTLKFGTRSSARWLVECVSKLHAGTNGTLTSADPAAPALARAVLGAFARGTTSDGIDLASLFVDDAAVGDSVRAVVAAVLGVSPAAMP
ncbi:MAG: hypothetical protein H6697_10725 [Myxococcales bacterium]|nr:hypothetical protein [Myxococcales bacterium]